ncbi:uncharacterized protein LOC143920048 [Arctopsyche grandis]|uniref:uncharacterized protein LOC143920048 n=1 Tax=Arctopsyche grandis TaxID=121162 RepID=UPI00406D98E0
MPRRCVVPGCSSNDRVAEQKKLYTSTFTFPKDPKRREQWIKAIKRPNFVPGVNNAICIRHFEERFIQRRRICKLRGDDGTELSIPKRHLTVTKDAYPTIFENRPSLRNMQVQTHLSIPTAFHSYQKPLLFQQNLPLSQQILPFPKQKRPISQQKSFKDKTTDSKLACRLCMSSGPGISFISIYSNREQIAEQILYCCQIQVNEDDGLSESICLSCKSNLNFFTKFRDICKQNDDTIKQQYNGPSDIKTEEVMLEDLVWNEEMTSADSQPNFAPVEQPDLCLTESSTPCKDTGEFRSPLEKAEQMVQQVTKKITTNINFGLNQLQQNMCLKSVPFQPILKRYKINLINTHRCEICLKSFPSQNVLSKHMETHIKEELHICSICSVSFIDAIGLEEHTKAVHENWNKCSPQ